MTELLDAPVGELEIRASRIADVNFPKRTIELVVMPYETETEVEYHGRRITEVVSKGAYDGIQRRASDIKVNRGHEIEKPVGKTLALHPSREDGLVAEVRMSRTELGEETLVLADDGVLGVSAGFRLLEENGRVRPGAEVWETRSRRRLNHLWLHHIAMTADPVYEGARVLAVRSAPDAPAAAPAVDPTPNLDRLRYDENAALAAAIDAKYGLTR